jgi:hypothetical protein
MLLLSRPAPSTLLALLSLLPL